MSLQLEAYLKTHTLDNIPSLNKEQLRQLIGALFQLRSTFISNPEKFSALLIQLNETLGYILFEAVMRSNLNEVMGVSQILGWVENGADIWPLIEPNMRSFFESLKVDLEKEHSRVPIIGVVGKIASGKGTVAEILSQEYDVLSFPFSDRLRAVALAFGFTPTYTRSQLREINDLLKPMFGKHIFVQWTLMTANRMSQALHKPSLIVVDGFRSVEETDWFLAQPNTHLVAIVSDNDPGIDRNIRFERQRSRLRGGPSGEDSLSMDRFLDDDKIESAWIDPVIALAREKGIVIFNSGSRVDLEQEIQVKLSDVLRQVIIER